MAEAGDGQGQAGDSASTSNHGSSTIIEHFKQDIVAAAMWLSRIGTIIFMIGYFLPFFGVSQYTCGQRVLITGAITSALRLHKRVPRFSLSREFLSQIMVEDSAHYLLYSVIMLWATNIVSMILMPVFLFALLHVTKYTKTLLDILGPESMSLLRNMLLKVDNNQRAILRLIATIEICLMPTSVILIFSGQASFILPIMYYRFLCLRYTSQRNPYNRTIFSELRLTALHISADQRCPGFAKQIIEKVIGFITRLSPVQQVQPAQ